MEKKQKSKHRFSPESISINSHELVETGSSAQLPSVEAMRIFPDRSVFLERMDADIESACFILEATLESEPQKKVDLETALGAKDDKMALAIAHKLKGSTGMLGASALNEGIAELERLIELGDWTASQNYFKVLQVPLAEYLRWLETMNHELSTTMEYESDSP